MRPGAIGCIEHARMHEATMRVDAMSRRQRLRRHISHSRVNPGWHSHNLEDWTYRYHSLPIHTNEENIAAR